MSIWIRGADAAEELAVALVGSSVRKAIDPLTPGGFVVISDRVSAALATAAADAEALVVKRVMAELDLDWDKLSDEAIQRAITAANEGAAKHYASKVLPKVDSTLEFEGPKLMKGARASIVAREKIEIETDLSTRDLDAEAAIRKSQVNFVRDSTGARIAKASDKAREIVARGFERGLGRKVIGADLRKHFAKSIPRPESYWNVVASAYIGRARSTSQIYAYEDAEIESYEVVSVIDEVTTDQCRYMNGKVFSVRHARSLLEKVNELENPEDVRYANPWIRKGKDASGGQRLFIPHADGSTTTIAKIKRSGLGTADDAGEFSKGKNAGSMSKLGLAFPPYHGHCRTVIVASSESAEPSPIIVQPAPEPLTPKKPTPPPEPEPEETAKPEHTPEHWLSEYKDYGKAAKTMAWGRASLERGLDTSMADAKAGYHALRLKGVHAYDSGLQMPFDKQYPEHVKTVRDAVAHCTSEMKKAKTSREKSWFKHDIAALEMTSAITAHAEGLQAKVALKLPEPVVEGFAGWEAVPKVAKKALADTSEIYSAVSASSLKFPTDCTYKTMFKEPRGYYDERNKVVNIGHATYERSTMTVTLHEVGHGIENRNPKRAEAARAFLEKRTKGEKEVKLSEVAGRGYAPHEVTKPDKLWNPYMGKSYPKDTEITSMTVQTLHAHHEAVDLYKADPESYLFMLGQLADQ